MGTPKPSKTAIVGKEYDERIRHVLASTLRELGATVTDKWWGVGGSQEIESVTVTLEGQPLIIEAETYMGLSITGEPQLVDRVIRAVHARVKL